MGDKPLMKDLSQLSDCPFCVCLSQMGLSLLSKMSVGILPPGLWDRPGGHGPSFRGEGK